MENKAKFRPNQQLKLMDQVKEVLRYHHYSYKTEQAYCQWIRRYVCFYDEKVHPRDLGAKDIERFLSDIAVKRQLSSSTQRQAMNALVFLYRDVLDIKLGGGIEQIRSKKKQKIPTVLGRKEIKSFFSNIKGTHALMAKLLFGSGLRLMECVRLRIKDVDFDRKRIYVFGKGSKQRSTILASPVIPELQSQIELVIESHHQDLMEGFGEVYIPPALAREYRNAGKETGWQYVFPGKKRSIDPRSGLECRHHVLESGLQKAVKRAAGLAGIHKKVTCSTLRHSFAICMLESGINIRTLQDIMGHADVKTTEIYTYVMDKDISRLQSPLENL